MTRLLNCGRKAILMSVNRTDGNIENLSEEERKLVENFIQFLNSKEVKENKASERINHVIDERLKICNELLEDKNDYVTNNYFTVIAFFMKSLGEVNPEQRFLFERLVNGNNNCDMNAFIVKANRVNANDLYEYLENIKESNLKYRLIIDCMVIAGCGEVSKKSINLIGDFAGILMIGKAEIEFLSAICKCVLKQNNEEYWDCKINNTTCIDSCIADEYMKLVNETNRMKFEKASKAFCEFNNEIALPLLCELADGGAYDVYPLLYWIYCDDSIFASAEKAKNCLKIGYEHGDVISSMLYAMFYNGTNEEIAEKFYPELKKMAEHGNLYAEYTLGIVDMNSVCGEIDYLSAANHFMTSYSKGFYRATWSMLLRFKNGDNPFSKNWINVEIWGKQVLKYNLRYKGFEVAHMYMNIDDYECYDDNKRNEFYREAINIWEKLVDSGSGAAAVNLGWMYENGCGIDINLKKAFYYYQIAADRGDNVGQCNLANFYENGKGTERNIEKAKKWYKKSAEQGFQRAIDRLDEI